MSLPETYNSSRQMARALASYIDCPARIRREVLANFLDAPSTNRIAEYRAEHLRARQAPERPAFRPYEGYYPATEYDAAAAANAAFLKRLATEARR